jgi:hypothetical protein
MGAAAGGIGDARRVGGSARRDREMVAPAPTPPREEGGAAKPPGLARLSSLRRLWNRGGGHQDTGTTSSRSQTSMTRAAGCAPAEVLAPAALAAVVAASCWDPQPQNRTFVGRLLG